MFLRVRMTDCDAGALGNPRNVGGHARAYLTAYLVTTIVKSEPLMASMFGEKKVKRYP